MFKFMAVCALLLVAAAALTVPSEKDAEDKMREQLLLALMREDLEGKDAASTVALLGCRLDPGACYDLVRRGIDTTYDHRVLYARFTLEGFDRTASCVGLFTQFLCPGGLKKQ